MKLDQNPVTSRTHFWMTVAGVDVWRFGLDCDAEHLAEYRAMLNREELHRADRFVTDQLRMRFAVARATSRMILAEYLASTEPADIEFEYGSHGKPSIDSTDWRFNLSHSKDMALLAVARHHEVGVDIERIDARVEIEDIADRFFTPEECADIMSRESAVRSTRFFDYWCCKEAYLKAVGVGISGGLNTCRIVDAPDGTAFVDNPSDPQESSRWRIYRLDPGVGYAGALCVVTEKW